jgi:hypothetical protein
VRSQDLIRGLRNTFVGYAQLSGLIGAWSLLRFTQGLDRLNDEHLARALEHGSHAHDQFWLRKNAE